MIERLFDESSLRAELAQALRGHDPLVEYPQSCDSTNQRCMQLERHAGFVIADQQTNGRGRRGRSWHSPAARSLYASIGVVVDLPASVLGLVSLLVGTTCAEILSAAGFRSVALKWPNDILLQGRKLGGILIETRADRDSRFFLVIGIGLNLLLEDAELAQIDQPAISLRQQVGTDFAVQPLVTELLVSVFSTVTQFRPQHSDGVLQNFARFDRMGGKAVVIKTIDAEYNGEYLGPAGDGQLQVLVDGEEQRFMAADISLREQS
jgi:BirA family biotin operon repressor/biotin-[acetyl-CoA-carboxylase] ligase